MKKILLFAALSIFASNAFAPMKTEQSNGASLLGMRNFVSKVALPIAAIAFWYATPIAAEESIQKHNQFKHLYHNGTLAAPAPYLHDVFSTACNLLPKESQSVIIGMSWPLGVILITSNLCLGFLQILEQDQLPTIMGAIFNVLMAMQVIIPQNMIIWFASELQKMIYYAGRVKIESSSSNSYIELDYEELDKYNRGYQVEDVYDALLGNHSNKIVRAPLDEESDGSLDKMIYTQFPEAFAQCETVSKDNRNYEPDEDLMPISHHSNKKAKS